MSPIEVNYRDANLRVAIEDNTASLIINGLERDKKAWKCNTGDSASMSQTLRLNSTVQTDYEWHEFIESILVVSADQIEITLTANNQVLKTKTVDLP